MVNPTPNLPFDYFISKHNRRIEREMIDNVVNLQEYKAQTAGKEPPLFVGNWLANLPLGTVFFVQNKSNPMDFRLGLFRLISKEGKVVSLAAPKEQELFNVNPVRFCNSYDLYESMGVVLSPEQIEEEKEDQEENEQSDRKEPNA